MEIFFPDNIFTKFVHSSLPASLQEKIQFLPSATILSELKKNSSSLGLIPTLDLINEEEIYVSKKFGLSFESSLCNSYIYYNSSKKFKNVYLFGDISSVEAILGKIFFKEVYDVDVNIHLITHINGNDDHTMIITGDENFSNQRFKKGISFAEEIIDLLSIPFVNFVFASYSNSQLNEVSEQIVNHIDSIYGFIEKGNYNFDLDSVAKEYIIQNISSVIYQFDEQDIEGINQLIRLPYFYGIIEDIVEVKFV